MGVIGAGLDDHQLSVVDVEVGAAHSGQFASAHLPQGSQPPQRLEPITAYRVQEGSHLRRGPHGGGGSDAGGVPVGYPPGSPVQVGVSGFCQGNGIVGDSTIGKLRRCVLLRLLAAPLPLDVDHGTSSSSLALSSAFDALIGR